MPQKSIHLLQRAQNCFCRLTHAPTFSPVFHKFKELHWLSVKCRVIFKVIVLTYKALWVSHSERRYLRSILLPSPRVRGIGIVSPNCLQTTAVLVQNSLILFCCTNWMELTPYGYTGTVVPSSLFIFRTPHPPRQKKAIYSKRHLDHSHFPPKGLTAWRLLYSIGIEFWLPFWSRRL